MSDFAPFLPSTQTATGPAPLLPARTFPAPQPRFCVPQPGSLRSSSPSLTNSSPRTTWQRWSGPTFVDPGPGELYARIRADPGGVPGPQRHRPACSSPCAVCPLDCITLALPGTTLRDLPALPLAARCVSLNSPPGAASASIHLDRLDDVPDTLALLTRRGLIDLELTCAGRPQGSLRRRRELLPAARAV